MPANMRWNFHSAPFAGDLKRTLALRQAVTKPKGDDGPSPLGGTAAKGALRFPLETAASPFLSVVKSLQSSIDASKPGPCLVSP